MDLHELLHEVFYAYYDQPYVPSVCIGFSGIDPSRRTASGRVSVLNDKFEETYVGSVTVGFSGIDPSRIITEEQAAPEWTIMIDGVKYASPFVDNVIIGFSGLDPTRVG